MDTAVNFPKRLYKYRGFNDKTVDMLVLDQLYFADPVTFNDPLDTKPSIKTDISSERLETILRNLIEWRLDSEMQSAARALKYGGAKTKDRIATLTRKKINRVVEEINYNATNPEFNWGDPKQYLLGQEIELELLRQYNKGVASFSENAQNPLMWSHYGDEHKGICIGYGMSVNIYQLDLHKVKYGGSRFVEASKIESMLTGDVLASQQVDEAVLAIKAKDWEYEREWRLIGPKGVHNSPFELQDITFGMRCKPAVKFAIIQALKSRLAPVSYFEIREEAGAFELKRIAADVEELCSSLPNRSLDIYDWFESLDIGD